MNALERHLMKRLKRCYRRIEAKCPLTNGRRANVSWDVGDDAEDGAWLFR